MTFARGKHAFFISDRSGMRFPYSERIREWTGHIVHVSEFEDKHPQLTPSTDVTDAVALKEPRPDTARVESETVSLPIFDLENIRYAENPIARTSVGTVTVIIS